MTISFVIFSCYWHWQKMLFFRGVKCNFLSYSAGRTFLDCRQSSDFEEKYEDDVMYYRNDLSLSVLNELMTDRSINGLHNTLLLPIVLQFEWLLYHLLTHLATWLLWYIKQPDYFKVRTRHYFGGLQGAAVTDRTSTSKSDSSHSL